MIPEDRLALPRHSELLKKRRPPGLRRRHAARHSEQWSHRLSYGQQGQPGLSRYYKLQRVAFGSSPSSEACPNPLAHLDGIQDAWLARGFASARGRNLKVPEEAGLRRGSSWSHSTAL